MRRSPWAMFLVLCVWGLYAAPAWADEKSDKRDRLIKEINEKLRYVKDKLDRVPGSSGYYEIDEAKSLAAEVKDKARELSDVRDGDSTADRMYNSYPGYVDRFRESCDYLKQMKDAQVRQADARLWDSCQEWDRKLREDVTENSPKGLTELMRLAEEARSKVEDKLRKADDTHRNMESSWKSYARNFSESDGEWSGVTSELRDAVDSTWDSWRQRHEATHYKCDELAKGKNHPHVVKVLEKLADNDKSRAGLYERLDKHLELAASSLSGLKDRSGTSELDGTIGVSDQLLATLDTLKSARGEDEKARKIADTWPDKTKELRRALEVLKLEKSNQYVNDKVPERCKQAEDELKALIQRYAAEPDKAEEGQQVITRLAENLEKEYRGRLEAAEKKRDELERYQNEAMRFSFDEGKWRPVKDNLHEAARGMYGYYKERLSQTQSACEKLAQGVKHPLVVEGLKSLGDTNKDAAKELEAVKTEYEQWKRDRKSNFLQWYKDDTYAIRDALCNSADEPELVEGLINDIVSRAQTRLTASYKDLEQRAQKLSDRLDAIKGDTAVNGKERSRVRSNIKQARERLKKAGEGGLLKGMNNPKVRSRVEYGKTMHKSMQDSCTAKEVSIDGGRIDCVKVSSGVCKVIEIKPENSGAASRGLRQAQGYEEKLNKLMASSGPSAFDSGGLTVFKQCMWKPNEQEAKDGKKPRLELQVLVETYRYCPNEEELTEPADQTED